MGTKLKLAQQFYSQIDEQTETTTKKFEDILKTCALESWVEIKLDDFKLLLDIMLSSK